MDEQRKRKTEIQKFTRWRDEQTDGDDPFEPQRLQITRWVWISNSHG